MDDFLTIQVSVTRDERAEVVYSTGSYLYMGAGETRTVFVDKGRLKRWEAACEAWKKEQEEMRLAFVSANWSVDVLESHGDFLKIKDPKVGESEKIDYYTFLLSYGLRVIDRGDGWILCDKRQAAPPTFTDATKEG